MSWTARDVAKMIDHSLLNPVLTWNELEAGCRLARERDVASVCILPYALGRCTEWLAGTTVEPSTTIGFPHGGHARAVKAAEARQAIADGGRELDAVVNISAVKSGRWDLVADEIRELTDLTHAAGRKIKIIFENCHLTDAEKIRLCGICGEARVDWVKTSTGYGPGGATIEDLKLMRAHSPEHVAVKAAGGIRTLDALLEVRALGVNRVGASKTAEILDEALKRISKT